MYPHSVKPANLRHEYIYIINIFGIINFIPFNPKYIYGKSRTPWCEGNWQPFYTVIVVSSFLCFFFLGIRNVRMKNLNMIALPNSWNYHSIGKLQTRNFPCSNSVNYRDCYVRLLLQYAVKQTARKIAKAILLDSVTRGLCLYRSFLVTIFIPIYSNKLWFRFKFP